MYSFFAFLRRLKKIFNSVLINIVSIIRNIKIQQRLILILIMLSVVPLVITSIFSYNQSSSAIRSKTSTYSSQVMNQVGVNIERELNRLENDSIEIEFSSLTQNVLTNIKNMSAWEIEIVQLTMKENLVKKFSFLHDVSDVLLYTNDRRRIVAYGDRSFKLNLKKEFLDTYLKELEEKEGTPVWKSSNIDVEERLVKFATSAEQMNKSDCILLGRAVLSLETREIIGTLLIRTNERYFSNIYRNIDMGKNADIFVVDSDGIVVSSRNTKIPVAKQYKDQMLIKELLNRTGSQDKTFNMSIDGKKYMIAFSYLKDADWFVVSTIPYSYLNAEVKGILTNIMLLVMGCSVLAVLLSYIFTLTLSKPLKRLINTMNEVKRGNLSVSIIDNSTDEIGEVVGNFNTMLNEIKNLMESVKLNEKQKREAEIKILQAQINPHFLSNTLNTVKWLAGAQKAHNIEALVSSLIKLLHVSMGKGDDFITMGEEVEYIKSYINIQEYRYYDKFRVVFEIEEDILDYKVLRFLIQPVVENAIIHGIGPMTEQGLISIKGFKYNDVLKIRVTDNGEGIPRERLCKILTVDDYENKSKFSGIGINNVNERIQINFGDEFGLHIESVPKLYTTVELTLPIIS
ncbi:integral membrane sensor signal transduction histidine kinase [Ruminiclostridium papyrosolvens DSM 2782]|uniref:Integral membrane sensor signal transduction histidine kinase n=1 Tax=Ruminiclostridium papyrosolvens DSM 2782 TaxID=588581 RepID=F1THI7_9FIRM|nr:integral membrane sensor signal transduction histidine kinase [Ruminiclostridium papyrosolvens DSM 2782]